MEHEPKTSVCTTFVRELARIGVYGQLLYVCLLENKAGRCANRVLGSCSRQARRSAKEHSVCSHGHNLAYSTRSKSHHTKNILCAKASRPVFRFSQRKRNHITLAVLDTGGASKDVALF